MLKAIKKSLGIGPKKSSTTTKQQQQPKSQAEELTQLELSVFGTSDRESPTERAARITSSNRQTPRERDPVVNEAILHGSRGLTRDDVVRESSVLRFFMSSTFTDTKWERDAFIAFCVPFIRVLCRELGLEFQLSEMRWGINDNLGSSHKTAEICMKELDRCAQESVATAFVGILGNKYGYRPIPAETPSLPSNVGDKEQELLNEWYKWDENSNKFVLLPITDGIPNFNPNKKDESYKQWWGDRDGKRYVKGVFDVLQELFDGEPNPGHGLPSVTQEEMTRGVIETDDKSKVILVKRELVSNKPIRDRDYSDEESFRVPLRTLKERLLAVVPSTRVMEVSTKWEPGGINPLKHREHAKYLAKFLDGLTNRIVQDLISYQPLARDTQVEEASAHWLFAFNRAGAGKMNRPKQSDAIRAKVSTHAFTVVRGISGSGKSTLLAQLALDPPTIREQHPVVVVRFVSATANSASRVELMKSICEQLKRVYSDKLANVPIPTNTTQLVQEFNKTFLSAASEDKPLLLILDAIDQIKASDINSAASWIPVPPPANVKIVVSTLTPAHFSTTPKDQQVTVPTLEGKGRVLLKALLSGEEEKSLTNVQQECLLQQFEASNTQTILQFKLLYDEAIQRWRSYTPVPPKHWESVKDVPSTVNMLFDQLEIEHGKVFTEHFLSLITWSRDGLSESELNDLLSLDDDVLRAAFEWWVPPVARVPPLMVTRLLSDLRKYLTEDNEWFHRQFREASGIRFGSDEIRTRTFKLLARLFSGNKTKVLGDPNVVVKLRNDEVVKLSQDRQVQPPLPRRKVREYPRILVELGQLQDLVELVCDFDFLSDVCQVGMVFDLQEVLARVNTALLAPQDSFDLRLILKLLTLSASAIQQDYRQLASQILARCSKDDVKKSQRLSNLRSRANAYQAPERTSWWKPVSNCLESARPSSLLRILPCGNGVSCLAFTPDGNTIACGLRQGGILLFDPNSGEAKLGGKVLKAENGGIFCIRSSQDGTSIVTGSFQGVIQRWDTITGELKVDRGDFKSHDGPVIGFSIQGVSSNMEVWSCSCDRTVKRWNGETMQLMNDTVGNLAHKSVKKTYLTPMSCCFTSDGKTVASVWASGEITLFDLETQSSKVLVQCEEGAAVQCIDVSQDGKMIAIGTNPKEGPAVVFLFDAESGKLKTTTQGYPGAIMTVAFSPDGKTVASGSDSVIRVWDVETGSLRTTLEGHQKVVWQLCFSPDGSLLASGSYDRTVRLWDPNFLANSEERDIVKPASHDSEIVSLVISHDGETTASSSWDNTVRLWDTRTLTPRLSGKPLPAGLGAIIEFSNDDEFLVSVAMDGNMSKWNVETGDTMWNGDGTVNTNHSNLVQCLAISPDGKYIATGSKEIRIWDATTGTEMHNHELNGTSPSFLSLAFSGDSRLLVSAGHDQKIHVWNVETGTIIRELKVPQQSDGLQRAEFLKTTGSAVVRGVYDEARYPTGICMWNASTGDRLNEEQVFAARDAERNEMSDTRQRLVTVPVVRTPATVEGIGFTADGFPQSGTCVQSSDETWRAVIAVEQTLYGLELVH